MYKKIFLALIAICGLFLVVGCHKDSDEEIGYYSAIPWNYTHDVFEVTITNVPFLHKACRDRVNV